MRCTDYYALLNNNNQVVFCTLSQSEPYILQKEQEFLFVYLVLAMSSGEDIMAGASFSDGQGCQLHVEKGHRKSILHTNLADSLKI